jgi:DNA-binding XRE family transcriptional regulator
MTKSTQPKRGPVLGVPNKVLREIDAKNLSPVQAAICNKFRDIRIKEGLTQEDFAETIGVTRSYVAGVEQGKFIPSADKIALVAKLYKVSIDVIFGVYDGVLDKI